MSEQTDVLYNQSCPVCRFEVHHYERISQKDELNIGYDDLGDGEKLASWGLTPDEAAKKLHVRKGGQVYAGIPAFIVLWRELPRYKWLAKVVSLPGVHWLACKVYDHILAPALFAWHKHRQKNGRT